MSHNQYNKYNFNDSSEVSDDRNCRPCERGQCFEHVTACIVCPPCDYREKYESEFSDYSCPDFSALCEDKPKICCEKRKLCKKSDNTTSDDSVIHQPKHKKKDRRCHGCEKQCNKCDSCKSCNCDRCSYKDRSYDSESESDSVVCSGCDKHCNRCDRCQSCSCRECSDYSRLNILNDLGGTESQSECPRFDSLALDHKKKCYDPVNPCKKPKSSDKPTYRESVQRESVKRDFIQKDELTEKKEVSSSSSSSSGKGKKFIVTFKTKEGHQWAEYNMEDKSIHINGKNGPVLHLYRGCTYFFCVEQSVTSGEDPEHSLILTNSPAGGKGSRMIPNSFSPVPKGCVCLKVDDSTPRYFFYQDYNNAFAGGLVIVHDK